MQGIQGSKSLHKLSAMFCFHGLQKRGILFKGFAPSLDIMSEYRVCLAPLRYGAGLKVLRV